MKYLLVLFLINFFVLSFSYQLSYKDIEDDVPTFSSVSQEGKSKNKAEPFTQVRNYPTINDSATFISELCTKYKLENSGPRELGKIRFYEKVKLFGSQQEFILLEYDYGDGVMAAYPWKYQFLFRLDGELIKILAAQRFELRKIFPKQNPFLITLVATGRGNGWHEIYKISENSLINIYDGANFPTYDAHQDHTIYEPYELALSVADLNQDGWNDLIFKGYLVTTKNLPTLSEGQNTTADTIVYSMVPAVRKVPVKHVFLYDNQTGRFQPKRGK